MKCTAFRLVVALVASMILTWQVDPQSWTAVAEGWHPWYEVHVDPEDPRNILICGSKWEFSRNALSGFVYRSADQGNTWRQVLEDKNSDWVSEQSCAFGPHHTAYFLSEASSVRGGEPNHHMGVSRLFISTNGGETWTDTLRMGWADWSTSTVNPITGGLVTFYHYSGDSGGPENYGSTIGVLTFGPDGKRAGGPFLNEEMRERNYRGVYPFAAVPLNDGTAGALYYGRRQALGRAAFDLGLIRFSKSASQKSNFVRITESEPNGACFSALGDSDLTHDPKTDTLAVAFLGMADNKCAVILAESTDRGDSWTKNVLMTSEFIGDGFLRPSLAYGSKGELGMLWLTRTGAWRFVTFQNGHIVGKPVELWKERGASHPSPDSMWTVISNYPPIELNMDKSESDIDITVRSQAGRIWRSKGLVALGEQFYAVGLGVWEQGQKLYATLVEGNSRGEYILPKVNEDAGEKDVTKQVRLVFGGTQWFDPTTGVLAIDLRLVNRGETPIWTPIQVVADEIGSQNGDVTVLNSNNGKEGPGAVWDLSGSVTGDQIPAKASMFNAFRLLFRVHGSSPSLRTDRLLNVKARVRARVRPQEPVSERGP